MTNKDPGPWPFFLVPTAAQVIAGGDNGVPWPFKMKLEKIGSLKDDSAVWAELIRSVFLGKSCRVFNPGSDIGTSDFVEDRVNIHLSDTGLVQDVTFG